MGAQVDHFEGFNEIGSMSQTHSKKQMVASEVKHATEIICGSMCTRYTMSFLSVARKKGVYTPRFIRVAFFRNGFI